jgi:diguanylate cyclase (GGDEF)-like protein
MVFAGKPSGVVKNEVFMSALPMLLISLIMMILGGLVGANEAKKLAEVISKEKNFLGQIADGNLRANLDADILKRPDELGEMGKFTVHVQRFIRDMIERDTLTKLYTRRIGQTRMLNTRMGLVEDGVPFQIVMGDIDHFKRFNDTYGHDCGDLVLQSVAGIFNRMMIGKGYAVRWGGEEFIIVYENMTFEEANEHLRRIREEVINHIVEYNDERLHITMTFGIVPGSEDELDDIIKIADELLYIGKEGGRDRIVKLDDYESLEAVSEALADSKEKHDNATASAADKANDNSKASGNEEEDSLDALMKGLV